MSVNFLISIIPVGVVCIAFYFVSKRKFEENEEMSSVGRKEKKDHLWLVIKEYLKLENRNGLEIKDSFVFERPDKKELRILIEKTKSIWSGKKKPKRIIFFKKRKISAHFPEEEYFDRLENETANLNRHLLSPDNQSKFLRKHRDDSSYSIKKNIGKLERRRYVIIFRVFNPHTNLTGEWEAIEAELFKNNDQNSALKDKLVVNRKLDYSKELLWIFPLKQEQEKKISKEEEKIKKTKNKKINLWEKFKNIRLWKKLNY